MAPPVEIGFYRIVNFKSKTCLDVDSSKGTPKLGDQLVCWAVDESRTSQVFRLTNDEVLTHVNTTWKIARDPGADQLENDTPVVLSAGPDEWVYSQGKVANTFAFRIFSRKLYFYMDLERGSSENGTAVRLWKRGKDSPEDQDLWIFQPAKDPGNPDNKPTDPGNGGGPAPDPDVLTSGVYRIRNLGSHTLLDHFAVSAEAGTGTEVKTFFDTQNPSQEWYVTVTGASVTIRNLVTGLYLQGGTAGATAKAGTGSFAFTTTLSTKPQKGWTIVGNGVALYESAGTPSNGSSGTPLAVVWANRDSSEPVNQRWWFTPVAQWEQNPLPTTGAFRVRAVQTQWAWFLGGDMYVIARYYVANSDKDEEQSFQWTAQFDKTSGTYSLLPKKYNDVFLALTPPTSDPTPGFSKLAGMDRQWAVKWLVRARTDRTVSFTPQGWNYELNVDATGAPGVGVGISPVSGELKYDVRWVVESV